jgi:uncharacterized protein YeaO (DUF488 family)
LLAKEMKFILLVTIVVTSIFFASCDNSVLSDVVRNDYADIAEAKQGQLFERGWLPNILPASTTQIVTKNDLDLNLSSGEFTMDPKDFSKFQAQLKECVKSRDNVEELLNYARKGYLPFCYASNASTWKFYINPTTGHCEYRMQTKKKS